VSATAITAQLAAIVGREPASSFVEVRPLAPGGGAAHGRAFVPVARPGEVARLVDELAPHANVLLGAAPRTRRGDGTAASIARVWCLWADIDDREALERARTFRPFPALVIFTGSGGAHLWWPLRSPLSPQDAHRANRRLALALGADMAATDAARVLRPVGSLNHKHTPPRRVECAWLSGETFDAREVVGQLADPPSPVRSPLAPARTRLVGDPGAILGGLVRVVATARTGGRNAALFWSACRVVEHADARHLDAGRALERLRDAALENGLAEDEITATLRSARSTQSRAAA
jgi:hypothetical protein